MLMRPLTVTADDLAEMAQDRYHHPVPRVRKRMEVVWLYHPGQAQAACAALAGVSHRSVQRYLDAYRDHGLAGRRRVEWRGPPGELAAHAATLKDDFLQHPPSTVGDAQAAIERLTGVRRGLTQVRRFLKKNSARPGGGSDMFRPRRTPTPSGRSSTAS
jgi:transposase